MRSVLLLTVLLSLNLNAADLGTIYVSDFEVETCSTAPRQDPDPEGLFPDAPVRNFLSRLQRDDDEDPHVQAAKLVNVMSDKLVDEFDDEGFAAQRLAPGSPRPNQGWLVTGVFTQIDSGNRVRRAIIGFGSGKTEIQVYATLQDLSKPDQPLYQVDGSGQKGNMPGAILMMNPYALAAKFVMSKKDLEKSVKKAAGEIAEQVVKKLKPEEKE